MKKQIANINIDLDMGCGLCGKKGALDNGICMECAGKRMEENLRWKIGDKTIKTCNNVLRELLNENHAEINRAYTITPGELTVNLTLKILPDDGRNEVKGGISFTIEKLKRETMPVMVDEKQGELFDEGGMP